MASVIRPASAPAPEEAHDQWWMSVGDSAGSSRAPVAEEALRKAGKEAGRLDGYTSHCNRHTFASRVVMAGVDLRSVQAIGGWRTLSMVQRELRPTQDFDETWTVPERRSSVYRNDAPHL
jgi:integrase